MRLQAHLPCRSSACCCSLVSAAAAANRPEPAADTGAGRSDLRRRSAGATHLPPGIDWFPGDVDAAFAAAKAANKPLFLYWGAEWCPPCAQIKSTIFNTREFQERSRLFVPVYLDGDTPSAQRHGERFGVVGYPTMILFRADGTEITRLPGGVDVARYATILDMALADARPVAEILRRHRPAARSRRTTGGCSRTTPGPRTTAASCPRTSASPRSVACTSAVRRELRPECAPPLLRVPRCGGAQRADGQAGTRRPGTSRGTPRAVDAAGGRPVAQANVDNLLYGSNDVVGLLSDAGSTERDS